MRVVVDVGGTSLRIGTVGAGGGPELLDRRPASGLTPDPVAALADCVHVAERATGRRAAAVTLGLPGSFDPAMETILSAPNLPVLEGRAIAPELAARLGLPVTAERDIALQARGEWAAGERAATFLGVFVGTGVGGAYLTGGTPFRGASGGAVEVGHLPVLGEGRTCVCGNRDCVEAYACGGVLSRLAAAHGTPVETVWQAEAPALPPARDTFVEALSRGLASAVNMLDPHVLVIGGGVPAMAGFPRDDLVARTRAHLRRPVPAERVEIRYARLGEAAALHGAVSDPHPTGNPACP